MTDDEAREAARRALSRREVEPEIDSTSRVIVLEDPPGIAVEAWVYLMEDD